MRKHRDGLALFEYFTAVLTDLIPGISFSGAGGGPGPGCDHIVAKGCAVLPAAVAAYRLTGAGLYVCIIHLLLKDCAACIRASRIPELLSVLFHLLLLSRKCAIV